MKITYCIECARSLTKQDDTRYVCDQGHRYYNNPRATATLVFFNGVRDVLYTKRARDPAKDKYDFPGGFLDYGENAYEAAIREAKEELGIDIRKEDLQLISSNGEEYLENVSTCEFIFVCHTWTGELKPADDVAACEWKPLDFMKTDTFAWHPYIFDTLTTYLESV